MSTSICYFSEPATLDDEAKAFLQGSLALAMESAVQGLVIPHIGRTIDSTVEAINAGLQSLKAGYRHAGQGGGDRRSRLGGGNLRSARECVAGGGPRPLIRSSSCRNTSDRMGRWAVILPDCLRKISSLGSLH